MVRLCLSDAQWAKMAPHCLGKKRDPGRTGSDGRLFLEAVLWIARTGGPWRDLPEIFGNWNTVFKRFRHWVKADVFQKIFDSVSGDPDLGYVMIDGSIVRVHRHLQERSSEGRARHAGSSALCACRPGHRHGQGAKGGLRVRP